jgi:hypothetical protein
MVKNTKIFYTILVPAILLFISVTTLNAQNLASDSNPNSHEPKVETQKFEVETESITEADESMEEYLRDRFPIISERAIDEIIASREYKVEKQIEAIDTVNSDTIYHYKYFYEVGKNYLSDTAKIMWELNIPEFRSRIYQFYGGDTVLIDTWNNVVGTINDKTYAGHFEAYKLRNWPSWKDPDPKKSHLNATPPGPNNPLGLFVVHYDENSLRYFHGTNKNKLVYSEMRNLSHGCVRNDNDNIAKMKEFLIKRVVKTEDLSKWMGSKKSLVHMMNEEDKFPVEIIYKTFDINSDSFGPYIEFYKDVYNYESGKIDTRLNDPSMIILTTRENIIEEYKKEFNKGITVEELSLVVDQLLKKKKYYEKYYFADLKDMYLK